MLIIFANLIIPLQLVELNSYLNIAKLKFGLGEKSCVTCQTPSLSWVMLEMVTRVGITVSSDIKVHLLQSTRGEN